MADDKEKTQRRVYVLPTELVERIVAYQNDMGLPSEVEAARRLLDEALKYRDDWITIARRFQAKLKETRFLTDIAKEVLMGHPLVSDIGIKGGRITFDLVTGEHLNATETGEVYVRDKHGRETFLDKDGVHQNAPF